MKLIKAKVDFNVDGYFYEKGDEVFCKDISKIVAMNEKGFIEPLSAKDIQKIKNELNNKNKYEEE